VSWRLHVPHRAREDSLVDVAAAAVALEGEGRAVARVLAIQAHMDGLKTAGDLLDAIAAETPEQRRARLDRAREAAGLPASGRVDEARRLALVQAAGRRAAAAESPWQVCAEPSCTAVPVNPVGGAPVPVDVRRWWCEVHRHLAAEGGMQPRPSRVRLAPSGALVRSIPRRRPARKRPSALAASGSKPGSANAKRRRRV
jgi:predicted phage gp36 major capsid-like protein